MNKLNIETQKYIEKKTGLTYQEILKMDSEDITKHLEGMYKVKNTYHNEPPYRMGKTRKEIDEGLKKDIKK